MTGADPVLEMAKAVVRTTLPARFYGPIRARRVRQRAERYGLRTVHHTYGGLPLTIQLKDPLAEAWYDCDWDEPPEITRLRTARLRPGALVFDIGAHQAIFALMLAGIVGPDGHVVAVEAERHNARAAEANVALNGAGNITVLHAAGAGQEGVVSFTESLNGEIARYHGAPGAVEVPAVTVDGLAERFGTPDAVLVDVEGYEGHVLDGGARTIAAGETDFLVELHDAAMLAAAGSTPERVLVHFDGDRFDLMTAPDGDSAPVWRDLHPNAAMDGRRCFVMARAVHTS